MTGRTRPIVAIDGPAGSGKSTVARELARQLGFLRLNTGALYRAVALAARTRYTADELNDPAIEQRLGELLESILITLDGERVLLDGRDVTTAIAAPAISELASRLSALATVRRRLREVQRMAGRAGGVVVEGRDIGTVIFPDAEFKFYLTASDQIRAQRRYAELASAGLATSLEQVLAQVRERDRRDQGRELAPLRAADDAITIDSSELPVDEVVRAMKARIQQGLAQ